jgi:hypothetical protein
VSLGFDSHLHVRAWVFANADRERRDRRLLAARDLLGLVPSEKEAAEKVKHAENEAFEKVKQAENEAADKLRRASETKFVKPKTSS